MAESWNIKSNNVINSKLGELDSKVNDWMTDKIKNPVDGFTNDLTGKISGFASNISNKIPEKFGGDLSKLNEKLGFDIENINLRDKLKVECPNFMKQCGLSQVDFGSLFLNPQQEAFIAQGQNITNDVINTLNGLQNYLTPEALQAAIEVIQFIITDLINTVINYCMSVFQTYVSPDFVLGLAKDIVTSSVRYTVENTKDPAKLLEEIIKDNPAIVEDKEKTEKQKKNAERMAKINKAFADTQVWIKKRMDEIQPYTSEIAKYMTMGPDYACKELEALYKKYLMQGISYVDTQLGTLNTLIDGWVDDGAEAAGKFAAEKINKLQEKAVAKVKKLTDTKLQQVKIKALSLINKVTMNLMAMLGG
jgi:hypothetical protein